MTFKFRHTTGSANIEWENLLRNIIYFGESRSPRNILTKELLCNTTIIDMTRPVITFKQRKMGYKFMTAEAAWILSGDNRLSNINKYSPFIWEFSDDGAFYSGAYGPKIVDQLTYICDMLEQDRDTRQAVLTIWRENPRPSRDIPCTTTLQFMIRDGYLCCFDTMRSSDVWLGWVYDVFNMSMLSGYILLLLRDRAKRRGENAKKIKLGNLYLTAGSQHLYNKNIDAAKKFIDTPQKPYFEYTPFDPYSFKNADELITHLQDLSAGKYGIKNNWLKELEHKNET